MRWIALGDIMRGRAIHLCRRSACRSRRCVGLCIVVVAGLAAAADAMLVATRKREVRRLYACRGREAPGHYTGEHDGHKTTACTLSLRDVR